MQPTSAERLSGPQREAARRLMLEAATVEVVRAFREAGIEPILLKGPALEAWLYQDESRHYSDVDLLVAPHDRPAAEQALQRLGYRCYDEDLATMQAGALEVEPDPHAWAWRREARGVEIDLHRTINGVAISDDQLWSVLEDHTRPLQVLGETVTVPEVPLLAIHLALHVTQDPHAPRRRRAELERAVHGAPMTIWQSASELAEELHVADILGMSLRQVPDGARLADDLGLPTAVETDRLVRGRGGPADVLTVAHLMANTSLLERLRYVARKALPPPAFLRARRPDLPPGPVGLVRGYLNRWVWLVQRGIPALRAYWRAHRDSGTDRRP